MMAEVKSPRQWHVVSCLWVLIVQNHVFLRVRIETCVENPNYLWHNKAGFGSPSWKCNRYTYKWLKVKHPFEDHDLWPLHVWCLSQAEAGLALAHKMWDRIVLATFLPNNHPMPAKTHSATTNPTLQELTSLDSVNFIQGYTSFP